MKKIVALLLVVVMLLGITACGSNNAPSNSQSNSETPSASPDSSQTQNEAKDPSDIYSWIFEENPEAISGRVRFWVPFKGDQGMDAMIAEFNQTYPNITVELNTYNNNAEGNTAVNTAMIAGEIDVLHSFELYNAYARWENGLYKDLTDWISEEGIDLVANWGNDTCKYEGRVYTLPAGGLSYYIAINKNAWDKAGLGDIPTSWTWDEYLEASRKMTSGEGNNKVYGGSSYQAINTVYNAMYQVYGKNAFYKEDGSSSADDPV
ncbi:MAG: extracellular solute-binding protein [Clostridiaceae bacterium]|nr:extracellular solute-binding protein [Clostridiaceae bacterium]